MPFTFSDDVGTIVANRLLKKYKTLRALGNSYVSHITESQGKTIAFVMFRGSYQNQYALGLYQQIVDKFPVVNDTNRKQVNNELDKAIQLANDNLPTEGKKPVAAQ